MRRRLFFAVACALAMSACGGATEPTIGSSSGSSGSSGASGGASSSSGASGGQGCTALGCVNAATVDFSFREQGTYLFEVTVAGAQVFCKATIPLPKDAFDACDHPEMVLLTLSGSQLSVDRQSIGGMTFPQMPARARIRAERDGVLLGDKSIEFVYQTTPGPNGPNCEPKECKQAQATFP